MTVLESTEALIKKSAEMASGPKIENIERTKTGTRTGSVRTGIKRKTGGTNTEVKM